jgi:hypothetical protein
MNVSPTARKLGVAAIILLVLTILVAGASVIALVLLIRNAANRVRLEGDAVSRAVHEAVAQTLKEGTPEQKLEMIRALREIGPNAREFTLALTAALHDADARVRTAAGEALQQIDPAAAERAERAGPILGASVVGLTVPAPGPGNCLTIPLIVSASREP